MAVLFSFSVFVLTVLCITVVRGQQIDTIHASSTSIEKIGYNSSLDSVQKQLGNPVGYSVYEEEGEAEGYGKWFYFTYDSLKLSFCEWNKEVHLSSFVNRNKCYKVELGTISVSVGDSLETLRTHFPNSFHEFLSRQNLGHNKEEFYIKIAVVYSNAVSYDGIVSIKIFERQITEISASFRPA